eukprot:40468-Eustigmatos_ZCMA.PRE.1
MQRGAMCGSSTVMREEGIGRVLMYARIGRGQQHNCRRRLLYRTEWHGHCLKCEAFALVGVDGKRGRNIGRLRVKNRSFAKHPLPRRSCRYLNSNGG